MTKPTKPPAMLVFINDYRTGTEAIPSKWRGPYFDLICAIWDDSENCKLNKPDVLARACRMEPRAFAKFWADWSHKFIVVDGTIRHKRVDQELVKYYKKVAKLQQNGAKGGKKTQSKQRRAKAIAKGNQSNGLVIPSKEGRLPILSPSGFAAFEVLQAECDNSGHLKLELGKLCNQITGYADGVLFVADDWSANAFSERLSIPLRAARLRLEKETKPTQLLKEV